MVWTSLKTLTNFRWATHIWDPKPRPGCLRLMLPHSVYIESHLGGSAIMKRKPAARRSIGIDIDAPAITQFSCEHAVELDLASFVKSKIASPLSWPATSNCFRQRWWFQAVQAHTKCCSAASCKSL